MAVAYVSSVGAAFSAAPTNLQSATVSITGANLVVALIDYVSADGDETGTWAVDWGDGTNWESMTLLAETFYAGWTENTAAFYLENPDTADDRLRINNADPYAPGDNASYVILAVSGANVGGTEAALFPDYDFLYKFNTGTYSAALTGGSNGDMIAVLAAGYGTSAQFVPTVQSQTSRLDSFDGGTSSKWGLGTKDWSSGSTGGMGGADYSGILNVLIAQASGGSPLTASGTPSLAAVTAAGTAGRVHSAVATATMAAVVASGVAAFEHTAAAAPSIDAVTASGVATLGPKTIAGTPSVETVTASGSVTQVQKPAGSASIDTVTASGTASRQGQVNASGTPSTNTVTASGSVIQTQLPSGATAIATITATGVVVQTYRPAGTPAVDAVTASGVAGLQGQITATGTPSLDALTSSSLVNLWGGSAGVPTLEVVTASGTATLGAKTITGTPAVTAITAAGSAQVGETLGAAGTPSITTITAAGTVQRTLFGSGTPSIAEITSTGLVAKEGQKVAIASPSIGQATASGVVDKFGTLAVTGTVTVESPTSSGATAQTLKPGGAATMSAVTASGVASPYPFIDRGTVLTAKMEKTTLSAPRSTMTLHARKPS